MLSFITYLSRQQKHVADMGTTCPRVVNCWLSTYKVTNWFELQRAELLHYIAKNNVNVAPLRIWWVSNEQHQKDLQWFCQLMSLNLQNAKSAHQKEIIKLYYTELLKAMKKERQHFRMQFENDYLLDKTTLVTGVKFLSCCC
jgi:hypothetical protein